MNFGKKYELSPPHSMNLPYKNKVAYPITFVLK